jgi:hypothetical protein
MRSALFFFHQSRAFLASRKGKNIMILGSGRLMMITEACYEAVY